MRAAIAVVTELKRSFPKEPTLAVTRRHAFRSRSACDFVVLYETKVELLFFFKVMSVLVFYDAEWSQCEYCRTKLTLSRCRHSFSQRCTKFRLRCSCFD